VKVTVYNKQSDLIISKKHIKLLVTSILQYESITTDEVVLHLVDKETIKQLHKKYFNDKSETDCISISIDGCNANTTPPHILGEVFVCPMVAVNYAIANNINPLDETALYIIHGLLHLIGYDDIEENDRMAMRKKEEKCMNYIMLHNLGISRKHTNIMIQKNKSYDNR
jgi:probable rRNA maturation factor